MLTELFAPVVDENGRRAFSAKNSRGKLKDWEVRSRVIGLLNDAVVNSTAVRAFLQEPSTQLQPAERIAVTTYLQEREREIGRLRRGAGRPWRPVAGVTFARRLARTIAAR